MIMITVIIDKISNLFKIIFDATDLTCEHIYSTSQCSFTMSDVQIVSSKVKILKLLFE